MVRRPVQRADHSEMETAIVASGGFRLGLVRPTPGSWVVSIEAGKPIREGPEVVRFNIEVDAIHIDGGRVVEWRDSLGVTSVDGDIEVESWESLGEFDVRMVCEGCSRSFKASGVRASSLADAEDRGPRRCPDCRRR